ncbi:MAG: chloride channel protein [Rickettsiales bacterium]|nr:chloride channel protein [Rickettsiales bacterium]
MKKLTSLKDILAIILIILTTVAASFFVLKYGELFFDFGMQAKRRLIENPTLAFFVTPIFFWFSAYLCRKFAKNSAGNTATPIETALLKLKKNPNSGDEVSAKLNFHSAIINAVSSLASTFGGGALGREAPSVYISTSFFAVAAQKLKKFLPKINLETWIFAGSAVGFAAAFHAPIAGFIYIVEKLFATKSKRLLDDIFWTAIALFTVIIILQKADPLFATYKLNFWFGPELAIIALIAALCGVIGFFFKKISVALYEKVANIKSNLWHLVPIAAGFSVAAISIYGGVHSFSGGIETSRWALNGTHLAFSYQEVLARLINTVITFVSGCAGGLVAPAIAIGAGIGSLFSVLMEDVDSKIFILSGMAAFLSPILGMPFAAAMVIVETSSQPILAFPFLFFSSAISFFTARLISKFKK